VHRWIIHEVYEIHMNTPAPKKEHPKYDLKIYEL
jgi:hypothetical protein